MFSASEGRFWGNNFSYLLTLGANFSFAKILARAHALKGENMKQENLSVRWVQIAIVAAIYVKPLLLASL